jgi:hypothetical protein
LRCAPEGRVDGEARSSGSDPPARPAARVHAIGAASRVAVLVSAFGPLGEPGDVAAPRRFDPILSKESAGTRVLLLANEEGSRRTEGSAVLVAASRAQEDPCKIEDLHMQSRLGTVPASRPRSPAQEPGRSDRNVAISNATRCGTRRVRGCGSSAGVRGRAVAPGRRGSGPRGCPWRVLSASRQNASQ